MTLYFRSSFDPSEGVMADASWKGKVCQQGHKCLTRHFVREGIHSCDLCAELIGADTIGGRCRACDFDICQTCFEKPAVTDVRVHDSITDVVLPPVPAPVVLTVIAETPRSMFSIFGTRSMPAEPVIQISDDSDNDLITDVVLPPVPAPVVLTVMKLPPLHESEPSVSGLARPVGRLNVRRSGPTATTQTEKPTMRSVETQTDVSEPVTLDDIKTLGLVTLEDVRRELWALLRN